MLMILSVQVPESRDRAAIATLRDGFTTIATDPAAASAAPAFAKAHDNPTCDPLRPWGHPPFGQYVLLNHQPIQPDLAREYGHHLLLFQPMSGPALHAESFGRLALPVYGGPSGGDRRMRRTQGGLRLTDAMLNAIVARLKPGEQEMMLELAPLRPPSWWQFWKSPAVPQPLSSSLPVPLPPPADELSLLQALLQKSVRRTVRRSVRDDRDDQFDRDRRDRGSSSSTTSGRDAIRGGGGESGGGGASGSWDAPARGAGPGVDSSGRIVGAAAAAGALGAMAGAAAASSEAGPGASSSEAGPATSSSDAGTGADTSTRTSY